MPPTSNCRQRIADLRFHGNLARWTQHLGDAPFAGAYATLAVVALISMVVVSLVRFPPVPPKNKEAGGGRPLLVIMRQPVFIVSTSASALGYGVMNLLMAASPIAMQMSGHPFKDAALVLEWHVIGMFAPGFFTGRLIKRFGVVSIMSAGVVLNLLCIAIALAGIDVMHFLVSMLLLGVGWNFLFTAGTALALRAYQPEEKNKVEGTINFCVFGMLMISSFSSGALVTTQGWTLLNYGSLVPVALTGIIVLWYVLQGRQRQII